MFKIGAESSQTLTIESDIQSVLDAFSDPDTLAQWMPEIESVREDQYGELHWKVTVEVPFVGSFTETFLTQEIENTADSIEWTAADGEEKNFLKYAADFEQISKKKTRVRFLFGVELRRKSASQLHFLAGFVGESAISREMKTEIKQMVECFLSALSTELEADA